MKCNVVDNVANDAGIWHSSFGWLLAGEKGKWPFAKSNRERDGVVKTAHGSLFS